MKGTYYDAARFNGKRADLEQSRQADIDRNDNRPKESPFQIQRIQAGCFFKNIKQKQGSNTQKDKWFCFFHIVILTLLKKR